MEYKQFYNYDVYEDGRVYSHYINRFLKGDLLKGGYIQYSLTINGVERKYKAHRLVAMLFLINPKPNEYNMVNHIVGGQIPLNNHYSNLEWCDAYHNNKHARDNKLNDISKSNSERWKSEEFRKKTSKNISEGRKNSGCCKGKKNPKFRYLVADSFGNEISRQQLCDMIGFKQSAIDVRIKRAAEGNVCKEFKELGIRVIDTKNNSSSTTEKVS